MTCMFFPVMEDVWFSRADCEEYELPEYTELIMDGEYDGTAFNDGLPTQSCATNSSTNVARYSTAFYNSMLLIQGEHIEPISVVEKFYCSSLILVGSIVLAVIFGNVSMYIANFSANSTAYQRKMEYLFESMNHLALPQQLKHRIIMYYDHIWKEYRSLDGRVHGFIPELSKQLESEVYLYLRTNLILSVPFLRQCSPEVVQRLVTILCTQVFLPNDYIVHKGVPGEEMYLISRGTCEVTVNDFVSVPVKGAGKGQPQPQANDTSAAANAKDDDVRFAANAIRKSLSAAAGNAAPSTGPKLSGRRRSSIVGAMSESLQAMTAKLAEEKRVKKGWTRPERSGGGLLVENKTYSARTMETLPISREGSKKTVNKSHSELSPR